MSFFQLLSGMAKIKLEQHNTPPKVHTPSPLNLSQESMVEIGTIPMILASGAGSLVTEIEGKNLVSAVGILSFVGLTFYRSYLSNGEGSFIQTATQGSSMDSIETRIYTPYVELFPTGSTDINDFMSWGFWLDDKEGYIGQFIMQGKNEDGAHQYTRSYSPANPNRVAPIMTREKVLDADGHEQYFSHRLMHYQRDLDATTKEYLLVSVVETSDGAGISMWLGLDLANSDLTVYPAGPTT